MKNKVHFVTKLCQLKDIPIDSEEAKAMYSLKIVDLLIEIKRLTPDKEDEGEDDSSIARLLGCYN